MYEYFTKFAEPKEEPGGIRLNGKGKKMRKPRTIYSSLQLQQVNYTLLRQKIVTQLSPKQFDNN